MTFFSMAGIDVTAWFLLVFLFRAGCAPVQGILRGVRYAKIEVSK
jgi:hypothetical protein